MQRHARGVSVESEDAFINAMGQHFESGDGDPGC